MSMAGVKDSAGAVGSGASIVDWGTSLLLGVDATSNIGF